MQVKHVGKGLQKRLYRGETRFETSITIAVSTLKKCQSYSVSLCLFVCLFVYIRHDGGGTAAAANSAPRGPLHER